MGTEWTERGGERAMRRKGDGAKGRWGEESMKEIKNERMQE